MRTKTIDCRSKIGVAISFVDTISVLCGQLGKMGEATLNSKAVKEAIRDLQGDELASYGLRKLSLTKEMEATNIFQEEVVKNMTEKDRKRISEIINSID
jgi:hypothetical protein